MPLFRLNLNLKTVIKETKEKNLIFSSIYRYDSHTDYISKNQGLK